VVHQPLNNPWKLVVYCLSGLLTFYLHRVLYYSKDILITVNFVKEVKFSVLQGRNMAFKPCNTVKEKNCVEDKIQCSCSFSGFSITWHVDVKKIKIMAAW